MNRRFLVGAVIGLLLFIAFAATACGGDETSSTTASTAASTTASTAATTTAPNTETSAASTDTTAQASTTSVAGPATGEPIKIGVISSLTGDASGPGLDESKGIKYMVDVVNKSGGINGRPLEIIEYDDQSQVEPATAAATRLIQDDKVFAIIGPFIQYAQGPVRAIQEQAKIVGVKPGATTIKEQNSGTKYTWTVAIGQDSNIQGAGGIQLIKDMGWKSVVGIGDVLPMNQENLDVMAAGAAAGGYTFERMVDTITFDQTDFAPIINKIKEAVDKNGADALSLQLTPYLVGPIVAGLRALGVDLPIFLSPACAHPSLFGTAGPEAVEGLYLLDNGGDANPEQLPDSWPLKKQQMEFTEGYKQFYGEDRTLYAAFGAGEVVVLVAAMRQAKDPTSQESVREALVNLKDVPAFEGVVSFTPDSTDVGAKTPPVLFQVKNGTFEFIKFME